MHHKSAINTTLVPTRPSPIQSQFVVEDLIALSLKLDFRYFRNYQADPVNFPISGFDIYLHDHNNVFSILDSYSKVLVSPGDVINVPFTKKIMNTIPTKDRNCTSDETYGFRKCFERKGNKTNCGILALCHRQVFAFTVAEKVIKNFNCRLPWTLMKGIEVCEIENDVIKNAIS